jgi:hypothetical protein
LRRAPRRASLDGFEHRGTPNSRQKRSGEFSTGTFGEISTGIDSILSVDDLVSVAYQGINRVEKKHRVATIRAADKVAARIGWACRQAEMAGHPLVYYNLYDVRSYTIGTVVRHGHVRPNGWRLANHQRMV